MEVKKLNVLVALVEAGKKVLTQAKNDYIAFFDKKQGEFKGIRKTYEPKAGFADDPSRRGFERVVTTVKEKMDYYELTYGPHINEMFNLEASNSAGVAKVTLVVDGKDFGTLSTLELLRFKEFLEKDLIPMYQRLPVRSDKELWTLTSDAEFAGRGIFEKPKLVGIQRTSTKDSKILEDPNLKNLVDKGQYQPQVVEISRIEEIGEYTVQEFSGEISHADRANLLKKASKLLVAIQVAIKEANDVESKQSELTAEKIFEFLHRN